MMASRKTCSASDCRARNHPSQFCPVRSIAIGPPASSPSARCKFSRLRWRLPRSGPRRNIPALYPQPAALRRGRSSGYRRRRALSRSEERLPPREDVRPIRFFRSLASADDRLAARPGFPVPEAPRRPCARIVRRHEDPLLPIPTKSGIPPTLVLTTQSPQAIASRTLTGALSTLVVFRKMSPRAVLSGGDLGICPGK